MWKAKIDGRMVVGESALKGVLSFQAKYCIIGSIWFK